MLIHTTAYLTQKKNYADFRAWKFLVILATKLNEISYIRKYWNNLKNITH